jgi:hypothetical protein
MRFVNYVSYKDKAFTRVPRPRRGKTTRRGSKPARTATFTKQCPRRAEFFALPIVDPLAPTPCHHVAVSPCRPFAGAPTRPFAVLQPMRLRSIIVQYARKLGSGGEVFDR